MTRYTPPLHIHLAFCTADPNGQPWSQRITRWLTGDRDAYVIPEANLPVFVWSGPEDHPPLNVPWVEAAHTALLLIADDSLVASKAWRAWVTRQTETKRPSDLLLVCTTTPHFANLDTAAMQAIRLDRSAEAEREEDLVLYATHALARWFSSRDGRKKPARVFISHAKAKHRDVCGRDLALALERFMQARPGADPFFDEVDIKGGDVFEEILAKSLDETVVIVLLTDLFSTRYWCAWEVATAKQKERPLLVVDALAEGERASLAYLGKARTMRWDASTPEKQADASMHRAIVAGALLELLRSEHDRAMLEEVKELTYGDEPVRVMGRPMELATLPERRADGAMTLVLHPDPPVPGFELGLFRKQRPDLELASITQALAGTRAGVASLHDKRVAVSISRPPDAHLASNGLHDDALERLWTQLMTHLLAAGAELAYGGYWGRESYTAQMLDLVRGATDAGQPLPAHVVHWYAGWPIAAKLSKTDKASLPPPFELHDLARPIEIDEARFPSPPKINDFVDEHHFVWTLSMRDMRRAMARDCHARVLVGGQLHAVSPWPGLLEELETFLDAKKPVYLLGAFGGMTGVLIRALRGESPIELTTTFQDDGGKRAPLRHYYEALAGKPSFENVAKIDLPGRVAKLIACGVAGLDNGLLPEENERLFVTRDPTEMIALILRGLRTAIGESRPGHGP